ncbi:Abi family protein [Accumulibacter sp.]|uniref:Abi family protein n=1 Tax=Accumulibacter sp. TaxID=2053492 RepID=UPI00261BE434|nr:Abi family protein [Accumulibacter sp.]
MIPPKPLYNKPALSLADQIAKLEANGMVIDDHAIAEHCLQHISYYRLSAYWLPFEHPKGQAGPRFRTGTNLQTVLDLYEFDRKLRLLVLDAVERVEVAARGAWAYEMAMLGDGFSYLDQAIYADQNKFNQNCARLDKEVDRSKDTFIRHYKREYSGPARPPVWMSSELLSFGLLSQWYAALKEPSLRQKVADPFDLDEVIFVTFLHQLAIVRNICAHHGRLWNRTLDVSLKLPKKSPPNLAAALNRSAPKKIYNALAMIQHCLDRAELGNTWRERLQTLVGAMPYGDPQMMGFPVDWADHKLWGGTK